MRMQTRTRALLVIAVGVAALFAGTQAFGVVRASHVAATRRQLPFATARGRSAATTATTPQQLAFATAHGRHFASTPHQAAFGHIPNTLNNRSIAPCPAGGEPVTVALMQGTTTLATASTTADTKGRWAVTMSIPHMLAPGAYAVTANCTGTPPLSYKADTFRVFTPPCPAGTTTTQTTVACHVPPSTSSTT